MSARRLALLLPALCAARAAWAHDSWLLIDPPRPAPGAAVTISFCTGEAFPESEHATRPQRVALWEHFAPTGRSAIDDFDNEELTLAARRRLDAPGTHRFAVSLSPYLLEMPAEEFNEYLKEEGQEQALAERGRRGELGKPARELYTKLTKSMVRVGQIADRAWSQPVGQALELVPLSDPADWRSGQKIRVQVLWKNKPAPGLRVSAGHDGAGAHLYAASATADAAGVAEIALSTGGRWYLKTFHIARARDPKQADWESHWATLSFSAREEPAVEEALEASRAIHGGVGPWVVAGYRMGQRALAELGLERGSWDLEVVHESPAEVQYACVADGLQAATGASLGRLSLKLLVVPAERMRTVVRNKKTGAAVVLRVTEAFKKEMLDPPRERQADLAKAAALRPEPSVFGFSAQKP